MADLVAVSGESGEMSHSMVRERVARQVYVPTISNKPAAILVKIK
ncbi:hypothetical protein [Rufibacter ruber]|nr:hypothetical protein [Rufibacter ruber]